jgi:hypothetical protein
VTGTLPTPTSSPSATATPTSTASPTIAPTKTPTPRTSAQRAVVSGNANSNDNVDDGDNTDAADEIPLDLGNENFELGSLRPSSAVYGSSGYDPLPTSRFPELGAGTSNAPIASTPAPDSPVAAAPVVVPVRPPASAPAARATPSTLPATGDVGPRTLSGIIAGLGMISLGVGLRLRRRREIAARADHIDASPSVVDRVDTPRPDDEHAP